MSKIARTLLFFVLIFPGFTFAQTEICWIVKDSIIAGSDSSSSAIYNYVNWKLVTIEYTDSASNTISTVDSILYGTNGKVRMVRTYDASFTTIFNTTTISYDTNDRVSRVHTHEDDGFSTSTIAHDVTYNSSGEMTDIIVDQSSVTGNPSDFPFNFENISWQGDNVVSLELVGDITGNGQDTIELNIVHDTMINVLKGLPIREVGDLVETAGKNNLLQLVTINNEVFGPAGTLALDRSYTYDSKDRVLTRTNHAAIFNDEFSTTAFERQCSGIGIEEANNLKLNIYPNPVKGMLRVESNFPLKSLKIISLNGQELLNKSVTSNSVKIDMYGLSPGVYVLELYSADSIQREKVYVR